MSPEAAAIILALLWGPTALWLIFRAVRGPTGGTRESFVREPAARRRTEQPALEAVIRNEYWICKDCFVRVSCAWLRVPRYESVCRRRARDRR